MRKPSSIARSSVWDSYKACWVTVSMPARIWSVPSCSAKTWRHTLLYRRLPKQNVPNSASSAESVGDGGFWEGAEGVVEGNFEGFVLAETVGVSEYHFGFVVEALDDT